MAIPLFRKVDCIEIPVSDLDAGLEFYRDSLGHALVWRHETAAGLRLPESDGEIVLQTERQGMNVDFLVESAEAAAERFVAAGGRLVVPPFDIQIGRAAVVEDPFGNTFVLLDASKGMLLTDEAGNILGNQPPHEQQRDGS